MCCDPDTLLSNLPILDLHSWSPAKNTTVGKIFLKTQSFRFEYRSYFKLVLICKESILFVKSLFLSDYAYEYVTEVTSTVT